MKRSLAVKNHLSQSRNEVLKHALGQQGGGFAELGAAEVLPLLGQDGRGSRGLDPAELLLQLRQGLAAGNERGCDGKMLEILMHGFAPFLPCWVLGVKTTILDSYYTLFHKI